MGNILNEHKYKKQYKMASCTKSPIEYLIPFEIRKETLLKIKQESLDEYGVDLISECPKRLTCIKKECLGRPLPFKSKTAKPYLDKLSEVANIKEENLYIETNCSSCVILNKCKSSCNQINDYIERQKIQEPQLVYRERLDGLEIETDEPMVQNFNQFLNIPWDCLSDTRKQVVKLYIYNGLDFQHIAQKLSLNNQARCKLEFYYALTTLSEFGIMRKFIEENEHLLTDIQKKYLTAYYIDNLKLKDIANKYEVSRQAVQKCIKTTIKSNNIKWQIFVKKKGKKVIYNTSELFK